MNKSQLEFKLKFQLPAMFAARLFRDFNTEEEYLIEIAKTEGSLCFSCLDYKDSPLVKRLREYYIKNKTIIGFSY